jgi:hypothetical protein
MDPGDPNEPCDPPDPPPVSECEQWGNVCLPLDPLGMSPPCPEGLFEVGLGCPFDESTGIPSVCCGFSEEPPRPPEEDQCAWVGGVCWGADESGNVVCPEGLEPRWEIPCADDGTGTFYACCAYVEQPPHPGECPDPNDPWIRYIGEGEACIGIEYICGPDGRPFDSPCGCGCAYVPPGEEPPPEEERCPDPSDPEVIYVSEDLAVCTTISYTCPSNHVVFTSPCGCGCIGY